MRNTTPLLWIAVSAGLAAWAIFGRLGWADPAPVRVRERRDANPWFV